MITIVFSQTFKKLKEFADQYNEPFKNAKINARENPVDDISKMLRHSHLSLMEKITKYYAAQLNDFQRFNIITDTLPPFRTNNEALATAMGCSSRNIQVLIKRLMTAGFIESKKFRGTNADYEMIINISTFFLSKNGNSMISEGFSVKFENNQNTALSEPKKTKFLHKDPLQLNKIITISGKSVDNLQLSPNLSINDSSPTTTGQESKGDSEILATVENSSLNIDTSITTPPSCAAPPQKTNNLNRIPEKHREIVSMKVQMLISFMINFVFKRLPYISASEMNAMREYFIDQFSKVEPDKYNSLFSNYNKRALIVSRWLDRDSTRYIPIPSVYFNTDNPKKGWRLTKQWLAQITENRRQYKVFRDHFQEQNERWKAFNYAVNNFLKDENYDSYSRAKKYLSHKYPDMAKCFDYLVVTDIKIDENNAA